MDIKKLQSLVVDALEDVKAQDIALFDTTHLTSLFDRIAIASGTSNRQTKALAASVRDKVKAAGGDVYGMEGEDTGEWVLVDLGDMIVHIMQAPIRAYYRLEEIWGDKPVKLGAAKRKSTKEGEEADAPKKVSSHLAAGKKAVDASPVIEKKAPARKAAAAKPAAATAAKKPAAKKAAVPAGKTIKVGKTKSAVAAADALKALPPKRKVAKPKADEAPVKTVIKRIKKVEE
ncbi:Iojap-like ribosome protein [Janthinobacterium sp. HH01]|uniref:Ribosomal silencing factor RsfS n=1 Tax=Rugamonas rivuli TaxID=2743358 RepID=A0A843SLI5_9BURK|nr:MULTISPECIES: ribosome silencing factor [Oxalobacteraceae]ELX10594.1 Iojap-like ribosome protein [Janthinobacterium sp. HH01]MQA21176.1 ribosome silencing factor [Rugamonas rivuli]OEZ55448.1 ribosomal silencing factor RsfS [Duganella sp. HH105]